MSFHEIEYPREMAFSSSGGPGHSTAIIEVDGGQENRVSRWNGSKHRFRVAEGVKSTAEHAVLKSFFLARRGAAHGFRYWDPLDHTSNDDGAAEAGEQDQQIGTGDGSTTIFQLVKHYTSGLETITRTIKKPIEGSLRVWVDGEEVVSGWTLDETTGLVTFDVAPGNGDPIHASYEFHVPVRASDEVDEFLRASMDDPEVTSFPDGISLVEEIDPGPGYTDFPYLGARVLTTSRSFAISPGNGRSHYVATTTTGLAGTLADPTDIPTGGPIVRCYNTGANDWDLKDHEGTTLLTLEPGQACEVGLMVDGSANKVYFAF